MEANFWHNKWHKNEIGFHSATPNRAIVNYFEQLKLATGSRVFLPLCGKTLDIHWLLQQGMQVVGIELSNLAVKQLFEELKLTPKVTECGDLALYQCDNINIFVGDFFKIDQQTLGPVDAVYDRAALVALPETMRANYTAHLKHISNHSPQLLVCFEYDQSKIEGPPFSISANEIAQHYAEHFELIQLDRQAPEGGLKGQMNVGEVVWLLSARA